VSGTLYSDAISGVARFFSCPAYTIEFLPEKKALEGGGGWVDVPDYKQSCKDYAPKVRQWLSTLKCTKK